jgi:hypothetical protein
MEQQDRYLSKVMNEQMVLCTCNFLVDVQIMSKINSSNFSLLVVEVKMGILTHVVINI